MLHVQQPLEGPSQLKPMFEDMYDEERPFSAWMQQLHGLSSEPGLQALHDLCRVFNGSFASKRPTHDRIAKQFKDAAHGAAQMLMFGGAFAAAGHGYRQYVLETALQSYLHHHVYEHVRVSLRPHRRMRGGWA